MINTAVFFWLVLLFSDGVSGAAGGIRKMSVLEGDSITLHTNVTEVQEGDLMMWMYGSAGSIIAKLNGKSHVSSCYDTEDGRFGDRLQLDNRTGSLSISDIRTRHSGDYQLKTISSETSYETFSLTVHDVFFAGVTHKREGEPVTLHTGLSGLQKHQLIAWTFGRSSAHTFLAEMDASVRQVSYSAEAGFRERLRLDERTGSLTISSSRSADSGVYQVQIRGSTETFYKRFSVFVSVPESGLSTGESAALACVCVLLAVAAAVTAGVCYYRRKYSRLKDEKKTKEVAEGDSFTLNTGVVQLRGNERIYWAFGPRASVIAQISGGAGEDRDDERFRGRLQINERTGDLTVKDVRITHSGEYHLKLYSGRESKSRRFKVLLHERLRFSEGENVCLDTGVGELHGDEQVVWRFGSKDEVIAERHGDTDSIHDTVDGRFRERLEIQAQSGSLCIAGANSTDSGVYHLEIRSTSKALYKAFRVSVWPDTVRVRVGEPVTLSVDAADLQKDSRVLWTHGNKDTCVAELNRASGRTSVYGGSDVRFRDRLQLDPQTGSLTIWNISAAHSDVYKLQMSSGPRPKCKRFAIIVDENRVSAVEGGRAELNTGAHDLQTDAVILWLFGPEDRLIAKADTQHHSVSTYGGADGRFEGRLELDPQTGSLTITNITDAHSGLYKLQIISATDTKRNQFRVTVRGIGAEDSLIRPLLEEQQL